MCLLANIEAVLMEAQLQLPLSDTKLGLRTWTGPNPLLSTDPGTVIGACRGQQDCDLTEDKQDKKQGEFRDCGVGGACVGCGP